MVGSAFCSTSSPRQYLQHGCIGYLVYVVDTQGQREVSVLDVPVIREFLDVFPEELPDVPPKRQV